MPDAIGERLNALAQKVAGRGRLRTVLRKQVIQKDHGRGYLLDLSGFLIERTFRGRDQQTQHQCRQRTDQTRRHFYDVL
jgi:hypothetical protein